MSAAVFGMEDRSMRAYGHPVLVVSKANIFQPRERIRPLKMPAVPAVCRVKDRAAGADGPAVLRGNKIDAQ